MLNVRRRRGNQLLVHKAIGETPALPAEGPARAKPVHVGASPAPGSPASHRGEIAVLGMPVRFVCEDAAVMEDVRSACAGWMGAADRHSPQ